MNFDKKEGSGVCSALRMDMSFGHDGGSDFSLPDYMPEIQRVLYVVPTVLPETKFLSGNVLELGGTLTYSVLYVSSEGKLSFTSLVTEYGADTALPVTVSDIGELFVDCEIEGNSCRVTGPRSLNIKTRLRSRIMCDEEIKEKDSVFNSEGKAAPLDLCASVERLCEEVPSVIRFNGITTESVSGEISAREDESPLMCEGAIGVSYCETVPEGVLVRGDVYIKCLLCSEERDVLCRETKIPYEITVPVRDAKAPSTSRAWGRVASVSVTKSEGGTGYTVSAEFDMEAECLFKTDISLCKDAYSTELDNTCETRETEILEEVGFGTGQLSLLREFEINAFDQTPTVLDVGGTVTSLQTVCSDEKLYLTGTAKLKVVYGTSEEYTCGEFEVPVKYEIPTSTLRESSELQCRAVCNILKASGKITGDKLSVSFELFFSYGIFERKKYRYVTAVHLGDEKPETAVGSGVKVYYPEHEENLWNICKRYHASKKRILKVNNIESEIVLPGKPVIIF